MGSARKGPPAGSQRPLRGCGKGKPVAVGEEKRLRLGLQAYQRNTKEGRRPHDNPKGVITQLTIPRSLMGASNLVSWSTNLVWAEYGHNSLPLVTNGYYRCSPPRKWRPLSQPP
ncbi:uncharacterized [Tachysurus ichikawai]